MPGHYDLLLREKGASPLRSRSPVAAGRIAISCEILRRLVVSADATRIVSVALDCLLLREPPAFARHRSLCCPDFPLLNGGRPLPKAITRLRTSHYTL